MNRQALAFLTMFSLILMLSVYYVTLPADSTSVMSTQSGEELNEQQDDTSQEQVGDAEKLQQDIQDKKEEEIQKQSSVVAQEDSNEEEKQQALETMEELNQEKDMIQKVQDALQEKGFKTAVEIKDGTCHISVFESEDKEENAKAVMDVANQTTQSKYLLEVTFK